MCGRYALFGPISRYSRWFGVDDEGDAVDCPPRYNVAPSLVLPVVRQIGESRRFVLARWGLVPWWAEDAAGNKPINAKVESAPTRPMFRDAWRERRVLVPADGFYEWQAQGGRRQPYFVRPKSKAPLGLGGLLEEWCGPGGPLTTFTLLTTDANELIRPLHDRMPVIIQPEDYSAWLDPAMHDTQRLLAMTYACSADSMELYPVGMRVNRPQEEGEGLIEPLGECE